MVEFEELTNLENTVIGSLQENESIVSNVEGDLGIRTFGQKVADKVAAFGGIWKFIIHFEIFILLWILANIYWLLNKGFDANPSILLNLILSCLS